MSTPSVADLRALSIRQPWIELILSGIKTVENRTWNTPWRGLLVLHAGQRRDLVLVRMLAEHGYHANPNAPRGYLGTARLADVHFDRGQCCEWGENDVYHWVLTDVQGWDRPMPGNGRLGLYRPPPEVATCVMSTTHTNNRKEIA